MDRKLFFAFLEPEALEQHEEAAEVIAVQVGEENAIDGVIAETGGLEAAADRFAAIHQERDGAQTIQVGRMIALGGRGSIADAKACQGELIHRYSSAVPTDRLRMHYKPMRAGLYAEDMGLSKSQRFGRRVEYCDSE